VSLIIHAPNVHQGGGRALLTALLMAVGDQPCLAMVDARLPLPEQLPKGLALRRVSPTIVGRLKAELELRRVACAQDDVLCFGNLPPLYRIQARVRVFVQNRYLLLETGLTDLSWWPRCRIWVERQWLRRCLRGAQVIVQTPSMAHEAFHTLGVHAVVWPFAASDRQALLSMRESSGRCSGPTDDTPHTDFLYVASGEAHKNHRTLIEAWRLLANDGLRPSLCLTLDPNREQSLLEWINAIKTQFGLHIFNVGQLPPDAVINLYCRSKALIYPSLFESFGLPLIEAARSSLPILAAERDYVRDVVVPTETFDPSSPTSIARAVRRFIKVSEARPAMLSPEEFLHRLV
jgi:glycosyltransferase involved in cell wall biosynthesis